MWADFKATLLAEQKSERDNGVAPASAYRNNAHGGAATEALNNLAAATAVDRRQPSRSQPSGSGGKPGWRKPATRPPAPAGPTINSKNDGKPPSPRYSACQKLPTPAPKTRASRHTYPRHACTHATQSRRPKQGPRKSTAPRNLSLGQ